MRILVSRYGALGDTVFMTSIIKPLYQQFPNLTLDLLISDRVKDLFADDNRIDNLFTLQSYGAPLLLNRGKSRVLWHSIRKPYDWFINLDTSKKSMRLARLIRAKQKWGPPYHRLEVYAARHAVAILQDFYQNFLNEDALQLAYPSLQSAEFSPIQKKYVLADEYLLINTTNSLTSRSQQKNFRAWPSEYWRELINCLSECYPNKQLILISSQHPLEIEFVKNLGPFPEQVKLLLGETTIAELISIIDHAQAIICTDTGPLHIAAAVNTPIVTVFGPSDWRNTGPFVPADTKHVEIISSGRECSPCDKSARFAECPKNLCMVDVTPEIVIKKLALVLNHA